MGVCCHSKAIYEIDRGNPVSLLIGHVHSLVLILRKKCGDRFLIRRFKEIVKGLSGLETSFLNALLGNFKLIVGVQCTDP